MTIEIPDILEKEDSKLLIKQEVEYTDNIVLPDMLYVSFKRSIKPHAYISKISNIEKIKQIDGVKSVITGSNCKIKFGGCVQDIPPLAVNKVRYKGEPVAAVIAETHEISSRAAKLLQIHYKEIDAIIHPENFINTPIIHDNTNEYSVGTEISISKDSNIFHQNKTSYNDDDTISKTGGIEIEQVYKYPPLFYKHIKPSAIIAKWGIDDSLTIWTDSDSSHFIKNVISRGMKIPYENITVIVPEVIKTTIGKPEITAELLMAYIARFVPGKAVKYIIDDKETHFFSASQRSSCIKIKSAVKSNGKIKSIKVNTVFSPGPYCEYSVNFIKGINSRSSIPYNILQISFETTGIFTNNIHPGLSYNASFPEWHWAVERHIDLISQKTGIDPLTIRNINLKSSDLKKCLEKSAANIGFGIYDYKKDSGSIHTGRGIAMLNNISNNGQETEWDFGCQAAEVEVNIKTGKINITRMNLAIQINELLNSELIKHRFELAILTEINRIIDQTGSDNPDFNFGFNRMLTDIDILLVVNNKEYTPCIMSSLLDSISAAAAPAIANAIYDAVEINFFDLPLSSAEVSKKIESNL